MGGVECVGDFGTERQHGLDLERLSTDPMLQRHAVQELHDDEGLTFTLADFMDRADIGMVERGRGASFTSEALQSLWVLGEVFSKKLQCDEPPKLSVLGLVHHTHPAAAEFLDDAIVRDGLADHWRESYVCGTGKSMKALELAVAWKNGC